MLCGRERSLLSKGVLYGDDKGESDIENAMNALPVCA
jgi:hypothetical protein